MDDILRMARQRGMQIPQPGFDVVDMNQIDERMKSYAAGHVEFVLYLDNKYVKSHCKYLKIFLKNKFKKQRC